MARRRRLAVVVLLCVSSVVAEKPPNVLFVVVESTDGRTWTPGYSSSAIPLPNIRKLQEEGTTFERHYSNAPVCCPSRATFWSGRHAHNLKHEHLGVDVTGVWNNFEGLPADYQQRLDQTLSAGGYATKLVGKLDFTVGAHSESVYLSAWTMYTQFPYDVSEHGGWATETDCALWPFISKSNASLFEEDWAAVAELGTWIEEQSSHWFGYAGMKVVHPPYRTNEFYFDKIDPSKVEVPEWRPLLELHDCDFQSVQLKGCAPSKNASADFYDVKRRRSVRRAYFAMIAEFDAMVGELLKSVQMDNTVVIVTSDHGDMQMEKQQFYKMVPYEASTRVPMIIRDGRAPHRRIVRAPTQLIDIYPTVMQLAGIKNQGRLDGTSLVPLLQATTIERDFVVSQFHGDDIAQSWFMVVSTFNGTFKLVVWGAGDLDESMLFDLENDPGEEVNLIHNAAYTKIAASLEIRLRSVVDYPAVALDVARYNHQMFSEWVKRNDNWEAQLQDPKIRWHDAFVADTEASMDAIRDFQKAPPAPAKCRGQLKWPP